MRLDLADLPDDNNLLKQLIRDLAAEQASHNDDVAKYELIIRQLRRSQFGRRSERLDPDQFRLGIDELDADIGRAEAKRPAVEQPIIRGTPARPALRADLPHADVTIDHDQSTCPVCGGVLHLIGVTTSEMRSTGTRYQCGW